MKHYAAIQNCLIFGLVWVVCASSVGAVQARLAVAPQATIQEMINAAPEGGTVNIPPGRSAKPCW